MKGQEKKARWSKFYRSVKQHNDDEEKGGVGQPALSPAAMSSIQRFYICAGAHQTANTAFNTSGY